MKNKFVCNKRHRERYAETTEEERSQRSKKNVYKDLQMKNKELNKISDVGNDISNVGKLKKK